MIVWHSKDPIGLRTKDPGVAFDRVAGLADALATSPVQASLAFTRGQAPGSAALADALLGGGGTLPAGVSRDGWYNGGQDGPHARPSHDALTVGGARDLVDRIGKPIHAMVVFGFDGPSGPASRSALTLFLEPARCGVFVALTFRPVGDPAFEADWAKVEASGIKLSRDKLRELVPSKSGGDPRLRRI